MVIKDYEQEDITTFRFALVDADGRIPALLSRRLRKMLENPENGVRLDARLDCRSMRIDLNASIRDGGGRLLADIDQEMPGEILDEIRGAIYDRIGKDWKKDILAFANEQVASSDSPLSIRDCMDRLENMDFGKMSFGVRDLSTDSEVLGDGVAIGVAERFPAFMRDLSRAVKETRLFRASFNPERAFECALVDFSDGFEEFEGHENVAPVAADVAEKMMGRDFDGIACYYPVFEVDPHFESLVLCFQCKHVPESAMAWIGIREMECLVKQEKPENRQKAGPKA